MTCNPLLLDGRQIEAHLIGGKTYAEARALAEGAGALVVWDDDARQAHVVPALAPDWTLLQPLVAANDLWATRYPTHAMHQARFDHIWAAALRRRVDPRLMVAILIHEGTGSFNTNPANASEYNGNGPDANWVADTARAISHVKGKLSYYSQAVGAGFREVAANVPADNPDHVGSAIQFVGWPGPIWRHAPTWGCYAQHADWWSGVTEYYEQLCGDVRLLSHFWSQGPNVTDQLTLRCEFVYDQPNLCSDLSGTVGRPGVVTWVL